MPQGKPVYFLNILDSSFGYGIAKGLNVGIPLGIYASGVTITGKADEGNYGVLSGVNFDWIIFETWVVLLGYEVRYNTGAKEYAGQSVNAGLKFTF